MIVQAAGTTRVSLLDALKNDPHGDAWVGFHMRYGELLYRYARSRGASHSEAEDVTQEVELYLFKAMGRFEYDKRKGGFRSYLRRAVQHAVSRQASKRPRQESRLDPAALASIPVATPEDDRQWEREWRHHRLRWLLRSIADDFEPVTIEAFRLHVLANLPVSEVADHLKLSRAGVYQAKCRVLRRLRERLACLGPDDTEWPALVPQ